MNFLKTFLIFCAVALPSVALHAKHHSKKTVEPQAAESYCAHLSQEQLASLPTPYNEVSTLLPFDAAGWYSNAGPLQNIIAHHPSITTIIEVGAFLGKSTRHIALCLPPNGKVYAVDHWLGSVEHQPGGDAAVPNLEQLYTQFLSNTIHAGLTGKIIPCKEESLVASTTLAVQADLVYIDASHDTDSVYKDLNAWYPHVKQGGILCGDDWSWGSVQTAVLQFSKEHPQLYLQNKGNFYWFLPETPNATALHPHGKKRKVY